MEEIIKLKLTPIWDLYPQAINDFRIYSCTTNDNVPIKLNEKYNNFVIKGEGMQALNLGEEYAAELEEHYDPKRGYSYKVISIRQEIPKTVEAQYAFLRTIVNENYVDSIQMAYPNEVNIVDLILENKLDYRNIKGIGDTVFIERIQKPVIENFEIQDALVELSPLGVTNTIIRKLISHYGGNVELVVQKVKENIYILCEEVSGIGFKKVDEYAVKSGIEEDSPYRINACIEYILGKEEGHGHSWIERDELIEQAMDEMDLDYKTISSHIKSKDFNKNMKFYLSDERIGLYKNYYYENKIADNLIELMNRKSNLTKSTEELNTIVSEIEQEFGFELTEEQQKAIFDSIHNNVLVISGRAGSGKSTNLKGIVKANIKVAEDTDISEDMALYDTCSLSGKASQRIIEATGLRSQTIHRLLGYHPAFGFLHNEDNPLPVYLIALDEGSMVDNYIFYKLISAINKEGKLIILGDVEQLAPIGAGAILIDMINSGVIPVVELTKVHRQAQRSGILSYANMVRDGIQINDRGDFETKTVGELQDLVLVPFERKPDIASHIIDICKKVKDRIDLKEFQIIVPMKERGDLSTRALNLELQSIFNPNRNAGLKRNGYEFKVGDKIIKRGNDYQNNVFNGTLGFIEWIDLERKIAGFKFVDRKGIVEYSQEDMKDIDMAYALTTHSNQGSQYKNGICAIDFSSYVLLSRQHIYTMLSRFSVKCMFMFENEALRYAIDNNETVHRNTFLMELLQEKYKNKINLLM